MRLRDGSELSSQQIEELNAHGPYSMAVWKSGDVSVGDEEGLVGRSAYFTGLIRATILSNFTLDELRECSILDIGCNDGWVLHELSDLPFARMVGVEPRLKNIVKGKKVREILKLDNRVEYRVGDTESVGTEAFDIVICAGVLYHVESIPVALRNIRAACKRLVFIESRCLSSAHITPALMDEIEMRDVVYQFKEKQCGITAQKFELSYHDGSAKSATLVNVPSSESLVMSLATLGFSDIEVIADPEAYRGAVSQKRRPLGGVCISATVGPEPRSFEAQEAQWLEEYERGLERELLPLEYVEPLYRVFCLHEPATILPPGPCRDTYTYLTATEPMPGWAEELVPPAGRTRYGREIVQNWRYCPSDKIALEYGKVLNAMGRPCDALAVLGSISAKLNADWRSVYRSFHLLSEVCRQSHMLAESEKYRTLCLTCNPKYPA